MRCLFFDIETTGLDVSTCGFKCAVVVDQDNNALTFSNGEKFASYLVHDDNADATFVSFNGLSYDFQVMFHVSKDVRVRQKLQDIAIHRHVDIMFAFLVEHGYSASMQSFAEPLGLSKTWSGKEAAEGDADLARVKEYCKDDVVVLASIYSSGLQKGMLSRVTKAKKMTQWVLPEGFFYDVSTCIHQWTVSPADQSWMTTPLSVSAMYAWTKT